MTIKEIVDYVMHTPTNTNPAVLISMLEGLEGESGGGSEDNYFSIATMQISAGVGGTIYGAFFDEEDNLSIGVINLGASETVFTIPVILFNGTAQVATDELHSFQDLDGDVELHSGHTLTITGDCAFTLITAK